MPEKKNDIPKTHMTSAITTDLPDDRGGEAPAQHVETSPAIASGVGLIKVDGTGKQYIGIAVARDEHPETNPDGRVVTPGSSTFQSIDQVPFSNSIPIKDPATGEFYLPAPGVTTWAQCELNGSKLIPDLPEPPPEGGSGGDGGSSEGPEQRSFAGTGTIDLVIDEVTDVAAVGAVEIEGAAYPLPAFDVPDVNTLHSTDGVTVWESGVNVLVTATYAGGIAAAMGKGAKGGTGAMSGTEKADREKAEKADRDKKEKEKREKEEEEKKKSKR